MKYEDIVKVNSEMAFTPIKGKNYAEVNKRVDAFRKLFPEGTIETEMIACDGGVCVFKAKVYNGDTLLGTGHAYEKEGSSFINETSYIENCETSAVGRALSWLGLGIEASIASYEEVANAKKNQGHGAGADKGTLVNRIMELAKLKGVTPETICKEGRVDNIADMVPSQMQECINWLKGM